MTKRILTLMMLVAMAMTTATAQLSYNLENAAVSKYLADLTYDTNSDYSTTVVTTYNSSSVYAGDRHRPLGVTLSWSRKAGATSQTIVVSRYEDFSFSTTYEVNATAASYTVYNLIPGLTYHYKVLANTGGAEPVLEREGTFRTTGQVRMIRVDGVNNVRDLGGWSTSFGIPIQYGRVYRGANLDNITVAGRTEFHDNVGVRAELDLRRADETVITSSPLGSDVNYMRLSTTEYYNGMANQPSTLIEDFKYIINNLRKGRPTMFHCLIGADRTGTLAFMQEGVLGVSENDLCRDYELTTFSVTGDRLRSKLADMVTYVKTFTGKNLQQKFYNYLLSKGMTREELDDYITIMLDNYTMPHRVDTEADQYRLKDGDTLMVTPKYYPIDYAPVTIYSSSNEEVATVDENGQVVAHSAGQAVIEISVGFHPEISAQVVITVQEGSESAVPLQVAQAEGNMVSIYGLTGGNLIENGSFEYFSPTAKWTTINNEQLAAPHFITPTNGAMNGGRYLQSAGNGDYTSPASIVRSLPVVAGKTYVLGYSVKNTEGKKITENPDFKIILKAGSKADGSTDDFEPSGGSSQDSTGNRPGGTVDDFIIGSNAYVSATPTELLEQSFHPTYDGEWTPQICIFKVPEGYNWVELQFANMGSYGEATCLDNFYMSEAYQVGSIPSAQAYLRQVAGSVTISNYGTEPLQHPLDKAKKVDDAVKEAQALANSNPSTEAAVNAINNLRLAVADWVSAPLNTPGPQQCYLIQSNGKVLTPYDDLTASFATLADNADQGFRFVFTTQNDEYLLEHTTNDGTILYIKLDAEGNMQLTDNKDDATAFTVAANDQEKSTSLMANGKKLFDFTISPDYGIINAVNGVGTNQAPTPTGIYNLNGQPLNTLQQGLNIIRYSNGSSKIVKK